MKHNHGIRNSSNWRYRVFKHYRHRVAKFIENASTDEERNAWNKVLTWIDSILDKKYLSHNKSIALPKVNIDEIPKD